MTNAELISKIKAEIERLYDEANNYDDSRHYLGEVLSFLDTLKESTSKDFPTTDEEIKQFLATHPKVELPEKYKTPDWIFEESEKPMKQEKEVEPCHRTREKLAEWSKTQEGRESYEKVAEEMRKQIVPNDLEEAAKKYATEWHENPDGSAWKPYFEVSAIKAFIAGAKWQKEQDQPITGNSLEQEWLRYVDKKKKESGGELPSLGEYGWLQIARHFAQWGAEHAANSHKTETSALGTSDKHYLEQQFGEEY